ncbi:MAG: S41 family peptidase [Candidatus Kapabacteria bacterium]|nr:S41 family peptidase [Ignavibacteriota bacterium]MCW5883839.1 S41 family peptidase [Candidatus Kapabacteria bacterium]
MRKKIILTGAILVIGIVLGVLINPVVSSDNVYNQFEKYKKVFGLTVKNYVDDVDTQKLTEAAIKGMLNDLDPHSVYIDAKEMKDVQEDFQGSFEGIGVQFDIINDTITIITPITGGPSEALGIQSGDKIINIDGEYAVGIDRGEVPKKLKGPRGTTVVVDIQRGDNPELIEFSIIRDKIPLYSVDASFMFDGTDVGFVKVNRFAANTYSELKEALKDLRSQGMKKLLLDLRGNPGGFLQQAYYMANEFLKSGDTIVYTKGRRPEFDEFLIAQRTGEFATIPIIVLINHGSASASEIVSGAIQDLDRGLVVGTTSFGKGLVQRQYDIGDGSAFRLTVSKYYTPSGRSIQRPYKDKKEYRMLAGRLELEEGSNIEHALEKVRKAVDEENAKELEKNPNSKNIYNLDSLAIHYTKSGRMVMGGGGVTPDFIVKSDTITNLSVNLRIKRIFYEFVNSNLKNGSEIKAKYKNNFNDFKNDFKISDKMFEDFRKLAESKDIKWNEEEFVTDKEFIVAELTGTLASSIWGSKERHELFYTTIDRQIQKALTLFPEAAKIAKIK